MGPCFSGSSDRLRRCLAGFLQDAACAWEVHIFVGALLLVFCITNLVYISHWKCSIPTALLSKLIGFVFFPFMMSRAFFLFEARESGWWTLRHLLDWSEPRGWSWCDRCDRCDLKLSLSQPNQMILDSPEVAENSRIVTSKSWDNPRVRCKPQRWYWMSARVESFVVCAFFLFQHTLNPPPRRSPSPRIHTGILKTSKVSTQNCNGSPVIPCSQVDFQWLKWPSNFYHILQVTMRTVSKPKWRSGSSGGVDKLRSTEKYWTCGQALGCWLIVTVVLLMILPTTIWTMILIGMVGFQCHPNHPRLKK